MNNIPESTSPSGGTRPPPDYKQVRKYLRTIEQREGLGRFIKAGWTPAELAEYARFSYLVPGQTKPTAVSYRFVAELGPDSLVAQKLLTNLRAPGFVMPPFDRPVPKRFAWDDPENPDHTPEVKADVDEIARCYLKRQAERLNTPWDPNAPIPRGVWKRSYRLRKRYHSLKATLFFLGLTNYRTLNSTEATNDSH